MRLPLAILVLLIFNQAHAMPECLLTALEESACQKGDASTCADVVSEYLRAPQFRGLPENGGVQVLRFEINSSSNANPSNGTLIRNFAEELMGNCRDWVPEGDWAVTDKSLSRTFHSTNHNGSRLNVELRSMYHGSGLKVQPVVMVFITMYAVNPSER